MTRVIGLISGTSVDGIDAALVDITGTELDLKIELLKGETYPYPEQLSQQIMAVCGGAAISMAELAQLDDAIAHSFAQAALNIQKDLPSAELIGSHGQNIYHRPVGEIEEQEGQRRQTTQSNPPISRQLLHLGTPQDRTLSPSPHPTPVAPLRGTPRSHALPISPPLSLGYSLQIGRGDLIARLTGIATISNFRVADVAAGGQGAPLVPKVDAYLLSHPEKSRCVQNLGGIGNLAYLPARSRPHWLEEIRGWDTGPANTLIDLAVQHFTDGAQTYDRCGEWAASGTPCYNLVEQWLRQDFFHQLPPKSTGRELFGSQYLHQCLLDAQAYQLSPADMLATLSELTVASIVHSYRTFLPQQPNQVLLCGGGSKNIYLKERLQAQLQPTVVLTTDEVGLSADFKEAIAFAVLAYWRNLGIPGNLPQVTGARQQVLLGDIHPVYFAPIR